MHHHISYINKYFDKRLIASIAQGKIATIAIWKSTAELATQKAKKMKTANTSLLF